MAPWYGAKEEQLSIPKRAVPEGHALVPGEPPRVSWQVSFCSTTTSVRMRAPCRLILLTKPKVLPNSQYLACILRVRAARRQHFDLPQYDCDGSLDTGPSISCDISASSCSRRGCECWGIGWSRFFADLQLPTKMWIVEPLRSGSRDFCECVATSTYEAHRPYSKVESTIILSNAFSILRYWGMLVELQFRTYVADRPLRSDLNQLCPKHLCEFVYCYHLR